MAGTNAFCGFHYDGYEDFNFDELPKGKLLTFALNPYNGNVVLGYNRNPVALEIATDLVEYVHYQMGLISDAISDDAGMAELIDYFDGKLNLDTFEPCPFCGHEPVFNDIERVITCCEGHTHIDGFGNRFEAIRFWNGRYSKFKVA